jgi:hypothetical protein
VVWIAVNPVAESAGVGGHFYLRIVPDHPSDFVGDYHFANPQDPNSGATISGEPECKPCAKGLGFGHLVSVRNIDIKDDYTEWNRRVDLPDGMSDTDYIKSLFEADDSYRSNKDNPSYNPLSHPGYNSNGYATGIIHATGGHIVESDSDGLGAPWMPGDDKPVPSSYFGHSFGSSLESGYFSTRMSGLASA